MTETAEKKNLDDEIRMLAAMAYGEASPLNDEKEMYALASVLERQRVARGYSSYKVFVDTDKSFSFVTSDGNPRYTAFMKAKDSDIQKNPGMLLAIAAAENAKAGGVDYSNGAYFWDGSDIKEKYSSHFKVRHGVKIMDQNHNIYDIKNSQKLVILNKIVKKKVAGKTVTEKIEIGRYDHVYESTAGHGGTIFWMQSSDYLNTTKAKPYK